MGEVSAPQILTKQPAEVRRFVMDFSNLMDTSETITSVDSATSELIGGGTSDLTLGSTTISGQTVTFTISGGTHSKRYRIEILISTSGSQTLEGDGVLKVSDR